MMRIFDVRDAALRRAEHRCEWVDEPRLYMRTCPAKDRRDSVRCQQTRGLQLHHLHYRTVGAESLADVRILCDWHHRLQTVLDWNCEVCGELIFPPDEAAHRSTDEAEAWLRRAIANDPASRVIDLLRDSAPHYCDYCGRDRE